MRVGEATRLLHTRGYDAEVERGEDDVRQALQSTQSASARRGREDHSHLVVVVDFPVVIAGVVKFQQRQVVSVGVRLITGFLHGIALCGRQWSHHRLSTCAALGEHAHD